MKNMQTIGERLEEARKRRGATLQEVAAATKIREEYIVNLEKNSGLDIPLEPIYIRGFINNYAKFLRTEPSRLLADFDANHAQTMSVENAPKVQKELIGRLELGGEASATPVLDTKQESPIETAETAPAPQKPTEGKAWPAWAMPVILGAAAIVAAFGVAAVVNHYYDLKHAAKAAAAISEIKLLATGNVTLIVRQVNNNEVLFEGTLKKGEEKTLKKQGGVRVLYSDGRLVEVLKDGKKFKMGSAGAGKRLID